MQIKTALLLTAVTAVAWPMASAQAGSLETHNNEVADGAIIIDPFGTPSRDDWATIPSYQADIDSPLPVLSHGNISIAHDSTKIYFRLQMDSIDELDPQQSYFGAHHAILIDLDQDRSTGWIGGDGDDLTDDANFAIGADIMIEGPAVWQYGTFLNPPGPGQNREAWTWGNIVPWGGILFDDGPATDIEFELLRTDLSDDLSFDFVAITSDEGFATSDYYPNLGLFDPIVNGEGEFFTYDSTFVAPNLEGDLDGDGFVGISDLNLVLGNWNQNVTPGDFLLGDPSGDGFVGIEDLNLVLGNWNAGTPPASVVPEPATLALLSMGGMALLRRRA